MINKATKNKVIIWGSNGCGPCLKVKQMCQQWNFEYEWNNIDDPEVKEKFMEKYPAILAVPIIEWNKQVIQGYEKFAEEIENTINNYGDNV